MTNEIECLERNIQQQIEQFERLTGLEVSSLSRTFSREAVVVTLIRKVEQVEMVTALPSVPRTEWSDEEKARMAKCTRNGDGACGIDGCHKCYGLPF